MKPVALLCAILGLATVGFAAEPSRGNLVLEWNARLVDALRAETNAPPLAVRNLAIFHVALAGAVEETVNEPMEIRELVVGEVACQTALLLYPSRSAIFDGLHQRFLPVAPLGATQAAALVRGRSLAAAALAGRSADGATAHLSYIPHRHPGAWRRTPPFFRPPELPHWPRMSLFVLDGADVPPPPPALDGVEYARAFDEVKILGAKGSHARTAEQTLIARFWSDFSFTSTPPGHWNAIARQIATERGLAWTDTARLFAALNMAMADAGIVMWTAKYRYNSWRPVTAIREAAHDGNDATEADPKWSPLLATPPHPEYVSGHSGFSAAAAAVLRVYFGTDAIAFKAESDAMPGVSREFTRLSDAVREISDSRIYGGIHFRFATDAGSDCGERVGEFTAARILQR